MTSFINSYAAAPSPGYPTPITPWCLVHCETTATIHNAEEYGMNAVHPVPPNPETLGIRLMATYDGTNNAIQGFGFAGGKFNLCMSSRGAGGSTPPGGLFIYLTSAAVTTNWGTIAPNIRVNEAGESTVDFFFKVESFFSDYSTWIVHPDVNLFMHDLYNHSGASNARFPQFMVRMNGGRAGSPVLKLYSGYSDMTWDPTVAALPSVPVTDFALNKWIHLAIVKHAPYDISVYLDGVRTHRAQWTPVGGKTYGAANQLGFGGREETSNGFGQNAFNGYIDEIRIMAKAATNPGDLTFPVPTAPYTPA